ncbi:MAG: DUF1559 domain-containing protein [Pirellulales bacterium]|nr:DUF1559 domain-containing protein [Pirellulales bacterium]
MINGSDFERPGSEHPGGAQFGIADGSVRFISDHADSATLEHMGTIDAGEVLGVLEP